MKQMRVTKRIGEVYVNVKDLTEFIEEDVRGHKDAKKYVTSLIRRMRKNVDKQ